MIDLQVSKLLIIYSKFFVLIVLMLTMLMILIRLSRWFQ